MNALAVGLADLLLMAPTWAADTEETQAEVQSVSEFVDPRPATLDYVPGRTVPPGYRVVSRYYRAALTSGTIVFGINYTASVIAAASRTEASATAESFAQVPYDPRWLYVPVVGPWAALATSFGSHDCRNSYYASSYFYGQCEAATGRELGRWRALLIVDGIGQGVGAALFLYGMRSRWYQLVLTDDWSAALRPVPMGHHGNGLALVGSFR